MTFTFPPKVLFKHRDPAGIVFFLRYFEMMNDCVEMFFDQIGHAFENMHKDGGVPTGKTDARFHAPSRHGDQLALALTGHRITRSIFDFTIETTCDSEHRMSYAATLVFIDAQGKSQHWTDSLRAALNSLRQ